MRACPCCQNSIYDEDALLCHFCGQSLRRASRGAMGKLRYQYQWLFWIVAVLVAGSFLFGMIF